MTTKREYNPVSRNNLRQYNKTNKYKEYEAKFTEFASKNNLPITVEVLKDLIPYNDVFDGKEISQFFNFLMLQLEDYIGDAPLKMSDLVEVINMCQLTVLKYRVIKSSKKPIEIKESVKQIESLDKTIEKIKINLGSNRVARIDPRAKKDINILDVLAKYETEQGRDKILSDIQKLLDEESEVTGYSTTMEDLIQ